MSRVPEFHPLSIVAKQPETADAVALSFAMPPELQALLKQQQKILTDEDFVRGRLSTRFMDRFVASSRKSGD